MSDHRKWVSLHNHSYYSILDGISSCEDLIDHCKSLGMYAIALTDHGVLHGVVDFYTYAKKQGIKPIIGMEIYVIVDGLNNSTDVKRREAGIRHVILAKNNNGYKNICKLSSDGFIKNYYYYPRIKLTELENFADSFICFSGSVYGPIGYAYFYKSERLAYNLVLKYREIFLENFYLEIQRHNAPNEDFDEEFFDDAKKQAYDMYIKKQNELNCWFISLSKELNIKLVATNDVHFLNKEDWIIQEILLNVSSGEPVMYQGNDGRYLYNKNRKMLSTHEIFLKDPEDINALFSDVPEAVLNTCKIADICNVTIDTTTQYYPVFRPDNIDITKFNEAERLSIIEEFLLDKCTKNICKRYTGETLQRLINKYPDKEQNEIFQLIKDRLDFEFNILVKRKICDYLLIVMDFISWAKSKGIFIGPGRGSGVGSIILFLLEITDLDPIALDLFFERFINPERPSYPDIDVDVCMHRRPEIMDYFIKKYGHDHVAHIVTYGKMKARLAVRDVGRVFATPMHIVNKIVNMIPDEIDISLKESLENSIELSDFYKTNQQAKKIIEYSMKLEGCIRNTGIHAAGILIGSIPLYNNIPLFTVKDCNMLVSQYSMKPSEKVGMLKIDVLGLKTLTMINEALKRIGEIYNQDIDITNLNFDDEHTLDFLKTGKSIGIFQMESDGMQNLLTKLSPSRFSDLIAIVALYRPGPMSMIPEFIDRKHGKKPIVYDHMIFEDVLKDTYGVIIYQEQVMKIAEIFSGYTKGEGDILRRAIGKKDEKVMQENKSMFCNGAIKNGHDKKLAEDLFDKIAKFADYGFNKSHAAAYAYISFITAYIKSRYPDIWLEVLLTFSNGDKVKTQKLMMDCYNFSIEIVGPDIQESEADRFNSIKNKIVYPITGIKGIGKHVADLIIIERNKNGRFKSIQDFMKRIDLKKIGKKNCITLADAGVFDQLISRAQAKNYINNEFDNISIKQQEEMHGCIEFDFFYLEGRYEKHEKQNKDKLNYQEMVEEKNLLNFFISKNPLDDVIQEFKMNGFAIDRISTYKNDEVYTKCFIGFMDEKKIITSVRDRELMALLQISDGKFSDNFFIWPKDFDTCKNNLNDSGLILIILNSYKGKKDNEIKYNCIWAKTLSEQYKNDLQLIFIEINDKISNLKTFKYSVKNKGQQEIIMNNISKKIDVNIDVDLCTMSNFCELKDKFFVTGSRSGCFDFCINIVCNDKIVEKMIPSNKYKLDVENLRRSKINGVFVNMGNIHDY